MSRQNMIQNQNQRKVFQASYADQLNSRQGPLYYYIRSLLKDPRFSQKFSKYMNITIDGLYFEENFAFMTGLVTGLLWGKSYFNTDFYAHKPLFALNNSILHNEKVHCEKLLVWLFRVYEYAFTMKTENGYDTNMNMDNNDNKLRNLDMIASIVEELRMVHLDEEALNECVEREAKKMRI